MISVKFRRFLVSNNAYFNYQLYSHIPKYIVDTMSEKEHLIYSFDWSKTKQGAAYWIKLDTLWRKQCND